MGIITGRASRRLGKSLYSFGKFYKGREGGPQRCRATTGMTHPYMTHPHMTHPWARPCSQDQGSPAVSGYQATAGFSHPQQLASSYFGPAEAERSSRRRILPVSLYRIISPHCPPGRLAVESGEEGHPQKPIRSFFEWPYSTSPFMSGNLALTAGVPLP